MKKIILAVTISFSLLFANVITCNALTITEPEPVQSSDTEYEYYDDGSYAVITTTVTEDNTSSDSLFETMSTKTKKASRTYSYYNQSDKKAWSLTLNAAFSYTGSSSKATSATVASTTYISGWKCSSKSASKSGATAKATGKFTYASLTKSKSIGLKCSKIGDISKVEY